MIKQYNSLNEVLFTPLDQGSYKIDHVLTFNVEENQHDSLIAGLHDFHVKDDIFQEFIDNIKEFQMSLRRCRSKHPFYTKLLLSL